MAKENRDMEKKATSSPARLSSCESKGKDNGRGNGNKAQRYNGKGKRDQAQGRGPADPSNGQSRRPAPQKSRAMDKRPRSRGLPASRRDEVTVSQRAEYGSALPQGPKKINLNHLINFTFAPREAEESRGGGGWRYKGRWSQRHPRFNKDQFLQANCQFVVKNSGDYKQQSVDPDALVDWDLIEQVRMLGHEMPSCPICLSPPTAAKITKCGHIYCWPCILHYISLGEKKWRKCPICYDSIMATDLKSVVAKSYKTYSVGESVTMRLMKREKGSVVIQPHVPDKAPVDMLAMPSLKDFSEDTCFSKLTVASPSEVRDQILIRELCELEKEQNESVDDFEKSFIQRALDLLKERDASLDLSVPAEDKEIPDNKVESGSKENSSLAEEEEEDVNVQSFTTPADEDCIVYASAFSDEEEETEDTPEAIADCGGSDPPASDDIDSAQAAADGGSQAPSDQAEMTLSASQEEGEVVPADASDPTDDIQDYPKDDPSDELCTDQPIGQGESSGAADAISAGDQAEGLREVNKGEGVDGDHELDQETNRERKISASQASTIYFYQAEDGQHLYLGSLNARCLMHEYGSLENCPTNITAKLVEMEHLSITQELRNRMRHLQHLPLTCEVCVCELDLRPPTLSHQTLAHFRPEIQRKRQKRDKKARDEKRRERKIKQEEDDKNGVYSKPKYSLQSTHQFPSFGPGSSAPESQGPPRPISPAPSMESATSSTYSAPLSDAHDDDLLFGPVHEESQAVDMSITYQSGGATGGWPSMSSPESQGGTRSFAQMLRDGVAKPVSPSKSGSYASTAQHQAGSLGYNRTAGKESISSPDSDHEDYVPVPQYKDAFSNAIQDALDKAAQMSIKKDEAEGESGKGGGGGRKNKKGRKKQQLLFSTAGPRFK